MIEHILREAEFTNEFIFMILEPALYKFCMSYGFNLRIFELIKTLITYFTL